MSTTTAEVKKESTEIAKADQFTTMIAEKKAAYSGLTIKGIEDKEGYKLVDAARKDFKSIRVKIQKFFKEERDTLNIAVKANLAKEKEVLGLVTPLEDELEAKTDVIDKELQRIADEEAAREKAIIDARFDRINKMGLTFDGNFYHFEDQKISLIDIQTCSDEFIDNFILNVEDIKEKAAEAKRAEAEQKAKEQAEIDAKQKAQAQQLAAEKAKQDKIAKEQAEKEEALLNKRIAIRKKELTSLGLMETFLGSGHYVDQYKKISIVDATIKSMEDDKWDMIISEVNKKLVDGKAEAEAAEKKRLADIETAKAEAAAKTKKDMEEKAAAEAKAAEEAAEKEKKKAARKEALRPDGDKLLEMADNLWFNCPVPTVKSEEAKVLIGQVHTKYREIQEFIKAEVAKF